MKYALLLLILLTATGNAAGFYEVPFGRQPGHLTPIDYPPDDYDQRIASHLFVTDGRLGRMVIRPSFSQESCLSVHEQTSPDIQKKHGGGLSVSENKKRYFITVTRASDSLYDSMAENNDDKKVRKVQVTRIDREINLELAVAIQRAWGKMLMQTRYPSRASGGVDGVCYVFSVWVRGMGDLYGQTWSPEKSLPAEMVSLGESLMDFASDKKTPEQPLIKKLKAFEDRIANP